MKKIYFAPLYFLLAVQILCSCNSTTTGVHLLDVKDFSNRIKNTENSTIIDVRTPEEFAQGHLINAHNVDWNNPDFDSNIKAFDKNDPVFVYCLSGGRSGRAVALMEKLGFKTIYELDGGMLKWRSQNMPETITKTPKSTGMSLKDYKNLLKTEKLVLIDFYAEWCGPCKEMEPYLKEIAKKNEEKLTLIRIDIDQNPQLVKAFSIDFIPVLKMYKNQALVWSKKGVASKDEIINQLKSN